MKPLAWMFRSLLILSVLGFAGACGEMPSPFSVKDRSPKTDADAPFDPPNTYPEWAYDAPSYVRAVNEQTPEPKVNPSDPLHYFTNQKVVMIRQPDGYKPDEIPRVAVWWTDNNGFHWNKGGYFGRSQTFFPFEVEEDGDYGIRFVGPGQEPALHSLPYPERVYHVDTVLPEVEVTVVPEQTWYHVGDTVTVSWSARDFHLIELPVRLGVLYDFTKDEDAAVELQRDLADDGSITYTIPQEALEHEIRFRADALDRAGNLGVAISFALQVIPHETQEAEELAEPAEVALTPDSFDDSLTLDASPTDARDGSPVSIANGAAPSRSVTPLTEEDFARAALPGLTQSAAQGPSAALPKAVLASRAQQPTFDQTWSAPVRIDPGAAAARPAAANRPVDTRATAPVELAHPAALPRPNIATAHEATPDGDGPIQSRDARVFDNYTPPASPDAVPSREPAGRAGGEPSVAAPAMILDNSVLAAIGITHSDGLLVPMPATVNPEAVADGHLVMAHPWRSLYGEEAFHSQSIWSLPTPHFGSPEAKLLLHGVHLAGGRFAYPVSEPASIGASVVSVPEESLGSHIDINP